MGGHQTPVRKLEDAMAELTMRYRNPQYARKYEPGKYPRGLPPNAADMRALVRKYCTQTGINYSDLANAHGAMDSH